MSTRVPSFFLLVPGPWSDARALVDILARAGVDACERGDAPLEASQVRVALVHDDGFGDALAYGRRGRLPADVVSRAGACTAAALLEIGNRFDDDPARVASIGRALRDAGGVAVRNEASGGASPWEPWLDQLESGDPLQIYRTAVVVVGDDDEAFTCGMHHFDLPDVEVYEAPTPEMIEWLETFCVYQLEENPTLGSGHTFAPDHETPRRKIERWPDHRHHPDDGRHNPFGLWRVLPEGDPGLSSIDPVPTLIPTLVSVLLATERSRGRALDRRELEALVDDCPAIALPLADAIALERSRGYADLEPRRAWAQWQLVREHLLQR